MAHFSFLAINDHLWSELLLRSSWADFYSTPHYAEWALNEHSLEENNSFAKAFYWSRGDLFFLIPLLFKRQQNGWYEVTSPYGLPGIVSSHVNSSPPKAFFEDFISALKETKTVSLFLRLHPIFNKELHWDPDFGFVEEYPTVYIDLENPHNGEQGIPKSFSKSHRWGVRKLRKAAFKTAILTENTVEDLEDFVDLYHQTMERVKARAWYYFTAKRLSQLGTKSTNSLILGKVFSPEGKLASAGLFLKYNNQLHFHLSATASEYLHLAPNKLLTSDICQHFSPLGVKWLHLGGGVGGRVDTLFQYKSRFSDLRGIFQTVKFIVHPEAYQELSREKIGHQPYAGFFPAFKDKLKQ